MNRRTVLAGAGLLLPGCLGNYPATNSPSRERDRAPDDEPPAEPDGESRTESGDEPATEPNDDPIHELGAAPRASVTVELDREYENAANTDDLSFDEWVTHRAAWAAVPHVESLLSDEGVMESGVHVSVNAAEFDVLGIDADEADFERAAPVGVFVRLTPVFDHAWEQLAVPEIEFDRFVDATPRSIDATVIVGGAARSVVLPVICRDERA